MTLLQSVSLEHIPRMAAPDNTISSAPKNFSVWALDSLEDESPVALGVFTYEDSNRPVQKFDLDQDAMGGRLFNLIELKVHSNHGNMLYTCLYRFRVHGRLPQEEEK